MFYILSLTRNLKIRFKSYFVFEFVKKAHTATKLTTSDDKVAIVVGSVRSGTSLVYGRCHVLENAQTVLWPDA